MIGTEFGKVHRKKYINLSIESKTNLMSSLTILAIYFFIRRLNLHKAERHGAARYPCDTCDYTATKSCDLKRHKQTQHNPTQLRCKHCDFVGSSVAELKSHMKAAEHRDPALSCDVCEYTGSKRSDLREHKQECRKRTEYLFCPRAFLLSSVSNPHPNDADPDLDPWVRI